MRYFLFQKLSTLTPFGSSSFYRRPYSFAIAQEHLEVSAQFFLFSGQLPPPHNLRFLVASGDCVLPVGAGFLTFA